MKILKISRLKKYRKNENNINIDELIEMKRNNSDVILLDVRSKQEFCEGHINGAINISLYELEKKYKYSLVDKNKIIIVYCQSGIRSKKAIKILEKLGFINLYNLKNGLDGIEQSDVVALCSGRFEFANKMSKSQRP